MTIIIHPFSHSFIIIIQSLKKWVKKFFVTQIFKHIQFSHLFTFYWLVFFNLKTYNISLPYYKGPTNQEDHSTGFIVENSCYIIFWPLWRINLRRISEAFQELQTKYAECMLRRQSLLMYPKHIRCWTETFSSDVWVRFVSSGMGLRWGLV